MIDETGNVYGRLTVIERAGSQNKSVTWFCLCSCGNEFITTGKALRRKETPTVSCGCRAQEVMNSKTNHQPGEQFGQLTVIKEEGMDKYGNVMWLCQCICGNFITTLGGRLRSGGIKTCGCSRKRPNLKRRKKWTADVAVLNYYYISKKSQANEREIPFNLTLEEYSRIATMICAYCRRSPPERTAHKNIETTAGPLWYANEDVFLHTLDRVNNKYGYENWNVVAACEEDNCGKNDRTIAQYKAHIIEIYNNLDNWPEEREPPDSLEELLCL